MSWLARSIANSLRLDDDDSDSDVNPNTGNPNSPAKSKPSDEPLDLPTSPSNQSPKGVKEDLTELKKTLTRQFWGVASFLAPLPDLSPSTTEKTGDPDQDSPPARDRSPSSQQPSDHDDSEDEAVIAGIRSDFAEIGGRFRTGISQLSKNKSVWEFTKIASNFLQIGPESSSLDAELVGNAVGVTEEVLAFARNISMHPETWLDFPLQEDDDESDDFELSDAQQEHALAIERLAPRLSALRMELCPGYMSEGLFWKVYFVLLHPRLSKQDAKLLSTPQIVGARAMLMQELQQQNPNKAKQVVTIEDTSERMTESEQKLTPLQSSSPDEAAAKLSGTVNIEMDKVTVDSTQVVDKPVVEVEENNKYYKEEEDEEEADDWLKEEAPEMDEVVTTRTTTTTTTTIPIEIDEEDVSFSDLEEEDDDPISYKKVTYGSEDSSTKEWVQLGGGSSDDYGKDVNAASASASTSNHSIKESSNNDWLNIDDEV